MISTKYDLLCLNYSQNHILNLKFGAAYLPPRERAPGCLLCAGQHDVCVAAQLLGTAPLPPAADAAVKSTPAEFSLNMPTSDLG